MMSPDRAAASRNWIAPGSARVLALLMPWLGPACRRWFGDLPASARGFFVFYPAWLAIGAAALAVVAVGERGALAARWPALWRVLDAVPKIASIPVVACGVVAWFLPLLLRPMPG
jgi:hypothetical protein